MCPFRWAEETRSHLWIGFWFVVSVVFLIFYLPSDSSGVFRFSNGEGHILYAAERNTKKAEFFDVDLEWENDDKILESGVVSSLVRRSYFFQIF